MGALIYNPNWDAATPDPANLSYAMYKFLTPEPAEFYSLELNWQGTGQNFQNLWVGIADFTLNAWDWAQVLDGGAFSLSTEKNVNATNHVFVVMMCLGTTPWELIDATVTSSRFGIESVAPATADSGSLATFTAVVVGGDPLTDTYSWDFGAAAIFEMIEDEPALLVGGISTQESPTILIEEIGSYTPTLTVVFVAGPPIDSFGFPLEVIGTDTLPEIFGIYPRYVFSEFPAKSELYAGSLVQQDLQAVCTGTRPMEYAWNFGGGATPNSFDWSPLNFSVTFTPVDTYPDDRTIFENALLNIRNSVGEDFRFFDFIVEQPPTFFPDEIHFYGEPTAQKEFSLGLRTGTLPLHYQWNFGGGAMPNILEQDIITGTEDPLVAILSAAGNYEGLLSISNDYTDPAAPATTPFYIHVGAPVVTGVSPLAAAMGTDITFTADYTYGEPDTWLWDFGTAATPGTYSDASPLVTVTSTAGEYSCSVTVTNVIFSHTFDFTLALNGPGDWWMFGGDRQHTRSSAIAGPLTNNVNWSYTGGAG